MVSGVRSERNFIFGFRAVLVVVPVNLLWQIVLSNFLNLPVEQLPIGDW